MAYFSIADGIRLAYDITGSGPPVLLLHGFPETRAMWDGVLPGLASGFTCVTVDLRGYGASDKPSAEAGPQAATFREMARDGVALMAHLGHDCFHVVGHDRGARTAYRMALDMPDRVVSLTLMDIVPTLWLVENWTWPLSVAYWHWSFLAQPSPLPERAVAADPQGFFEACLTGWGSAEPSDFAAIETYRRAWRDPDTVRGMIDDYRAAVTLDVAHDREDRQRVLANPALVLWGADGVMARLTDVAAIWSERLSDITVGTIPGGHFFPEQSPKETTRAVLDFLNRLEDRPDRALDG